MSNKPGKKRNLKHKDTARNDRIKLKEKEIRKSLNVVIWNDELIHKLMEKFKIINYKIMPWEEIQITTKYGSWKIEHDSVVITLKHENNRTAAYQNDRGSNHLQNVFYDLEFCVRSIVDHERYLEENRFGSSI